METTENSTPANESVSGSDAIARQAAENGDGNDQSTPRYVKKNNKKIATKRNSMVSKNGKLDRLEKELEGLQSDLKRGYRIEKDDDEGTTQHIPILGSERNVIDAQIQDLKIQIFDLKEEIAELDNEISMLSTNKSSSLKGKLNDRKTAKKVNAFVTRIQSGLKGSNTNGANNGLVEMQTKIKESGRNEAYRSLKNFLGKELQPVAKKLGKSSQLEETVLNKVLDKLTSN